MEDLKGATKQGNKITMGEICKTSGVQGGLLTINNSLDPPYAKGDYETNGIPGAAGSISNSGGNHWGQ